ncbi:hypothetical protein [Streptomyces sp. PsTaAH-124]|uniref:hypothetical protein n=1 Tax=Streptomyces sp. PsTaAH-124 TaxID=1157638 RepID=UPI00037BC16F|nr:hypothetical protein [Streptomyces sp. PsTaAH-124]
MLFNRKKTQEAALLTALREAALRAIWRLEQENGPGDINPHTTSVSAYSLASMLTFSADASKINVGNVIARVAHMIYAGKPTRRDSRLAWTVWELERLGLAEAAQQLTELVRTHGGTRAR